MSARSIYRNYRQLWINHNGPIPKDEFGRSFEIHHINGNHEDNRIENLQCVSIQEHYDIHFKQGDYGACTLIAKRLNMTNRETFNLASHLAKVNTKNLLESNTHNWLKDNVIKKECNWCKMMVIPNIYTLYHGDYCKQNPNALPYRSHKPHKSHVKKECKWCHNMFDPSMLARWHGDNCKEKPIGKF